MGTSCHWCVQTRIETGWNLRPGTLCYSACTWTKCLIELKNAKGNSEGLRDNSACTVGGNYGQQDAKKSSCSSPPKIIIIIIRPKTQLPLLRLGTKLWCWEQNQGTLHASSNFNTTKRVGNHINHPSSLLGTPTLTL